MKRVLPIVLLAALVAVALAQSRPADSPPPSSRPARTLTTGQVRPVLQLHRRAIRLAMRGKFAQCEPLLKKLLAIDPTDSTGWYNMACVHSRLGRKGQALDALERALSFGYAGIRHMQRDPDLKDLRNLPRFKAIIARSAEIQRARAEKIREDMRETFGEGYIIEVDHDNKLVFATNIDRRTLGKLRDFLTAYAKGHWAAGRFKHHFEQYITVVVPRADDKRFRRRGVGGYYMHGTRMLVARQIGMIMTHEFTHALHFADQDGYGQRHPIWVAEGYATLFETSRLEKGRPVPLPNHRLTMLKRLIRRDRTIEFAKFFKQSHRDFMRTSVVAYPQTRYIMMYLHETGKLSEWYDAYVAGFEEDRTGAKALEKVLGKDLDEIEEAWKEWVLAQKGPPRRLRSGSAYIGVRTRGRIDGLQVVQTVSGSGAAKAGLKSGDVIVGIDGERMIDPAALLQLVVDHKPGDKLEITYRRDGKYDTTTVTLGKWQAGRPARTQPKPKPKTTPVPPEPTSRPAKKKAA